MTAERREYEVVFKESGMDEMERKSDLLQKGFDQLTGKMKSLASAAAIAGAAFVTFKAVQVAGDFEALEVRLQNLFNSVEDGTRAFNNFKSVASTTPFAVREVVEAGAQLKAFGINAENNIKITADLAAFMGTDMVEAASAMGRAFAGGAGAADIFRERGILTLIRTKQNIDTTKASIDEFRKAMFDTFNDPTSGISGATDKLSKTFVGAVSNAGDAISNLAATIGEKLLPATKETLSEFTKFTNALSLIIESEVPQSEGGFMSMFLDLAEANPGLGLGNLIRQLRGVNEAVQVQGDKLKAVKDGRAAFLDHNRMLKEQLETEQKIAREKAYEVMLDRLGDRLTESVNPAIRDFNRAANETVAGLSFIGLEATEVDPIIRRLSESMEQFVGAGQKAEKIAPDANAWDLFRSKVEDVSGVIQRSFLDQWREGENLFESFGDAFVEMLERMASELLARAAIFSILNFIPGLANIGLGSGNFLDAVLGPVLDQGTGSLNFGNSNNLAPSGNGGTVIVQAWDSENVVSFLRRGDNAKNILTELGSTI